MTIAFTFDAKFCSGCKVCQAACKDKHNLPVGVLWRRVIEVSGGEWNNLGAGSSNPVWENTVFAYNLSISCNHCVHPKCAGVCPTNAYDVRETGIVILDTTKCAGCGYCAWACPYGAPQYNHEAGAMTKCDFCFDQLDQGLPPACVAACPLRVLDFVEDSEQSGAEENGRGRMELWKLPGTDHPFPLPAFSRTEPRLAVQPHPAMGNSLEKTVANTEEVQPRAASAREELPLILFTLLGQTAVGGFWSMLWIFPMLWAPTEFESVTLRWLPALAVGICLGIATFASFAHLGTKKNAWRTLAHLSHSWLSREILFTGLFGLGWLVTTGQIIAQQRISVEALGITATFGFGLVYSMGQVYRLKAAPSWNTWRTNVGFLVSALLMGQALMSSLSWLGLERRAIHFFPTSNALIIALLVTQWLLIQEKTADASLQNIRKGLILTGILASITGILFAPPYGIPLSLLTLLIVMAEEGIGRWLFYQSRTVVIN